MVAIKVQGRLGNQLFQYAFVYATAKKLNTSFYIDQSIEPFLIDNYFVPLDGNSNNLIESLFKIKGFKNIFSFYLRRSYYKYLAQIFKLKNLSYSDQVLAKDILLQNNTVYEGFFQSELFFSPFQEIIRNKLVIKKKFTDGFGVKYGHIYKKKTVVVHIRRTDYQQLSHLNLGNQDLTLPLNYYLKALSNFTDPESNFVFIGDDVLFLEENFNHLNNKLVCHDDEIMDFQHLLNATACIISNSTFSWWGAWLNPNANKIVYAPKYFLGWQVQQEYPQNIYPEGWNIINF